MDNKTLRFLVIEDHFMMIDEAKAYFQQLPENIQVELVENLVQAREKFGREKYDGIISDVFFPTGLSENDGRKIKIAIGDELLNMPDAIFEKDHYDRVVLWQMTDRLAPLGIQVFKEANIPVVFCTSGYHHDTNLEPVYVFSNQNKIDLIDSGDREDGMIKNWELALKTLIANIAFDKSMVMAEVIKFDISDTSYREKVTAVKEHFKIELSGLIEYDEDLFEDQFMKHIS